jgi:hypothetical protein
LPARLDARAQLKDLRVAAFRRHIDATECVARELELHARWIGSGLIGPRAHAQNVLARALELVVDADEAVAVERPGAVARREFLGVHDRAVGDAHAPRILLVGDEDRLRGDALGRHDVLLEEDIGHRQHVADRVEAVAHLVGREPALRVETHAAQVGHAVLVLAPVQPSQRRAPGIARARELGVDPRKRARHVLRPRLARLARRHAPRAQLRRDRAQQREVGLARFRREQAIELQLALGVVPRVALHAARLEQWRERAFLCRAGSHGKD